MPKNLKIENNNLIITIPFKRQRNNPYDPEYKEEMNNIAGLYEDEFNNGLVYLIDMDYTGKPDQHTDYFYKTECSKEEFDKMIEELKIDGIYPEKCNKCKKTIYGSYTWDKGPLCLNCKKI